MGITLVAALDDGNAIGRQNTLPWRLKADLKHFQDLTKGKVVVMGRKTYDSLPDRYRPLPNRTNWVVTRDMRLGSDLRRMIAHSIHPVLSRATREEIFVIGGEEIYKLFLPHATKLILTHVRTRIPNADAFFPDIPEKWWRVGTILDQDADKDNDFAFQVVEYAND